MASTDNKRIAKNTLFLYLRMLLVMGVTLYTSRVVLEGLGVDDFGIYNVIGGLSFSFIFFSSALTNATQRFLNFEHGTRNTTKLNDIFNLSLLIYTFIAICVLIIGSVFGTFFIKYKLSIPPGSITPACIVLYTTLLSLTFTFIGSVYESVLISHENMKIYAYFGIIDAIGKLLVAFIIIHIPANRLTIYAILIASIQIIPKIILFYYCKKTYPETKIRYYWNKPLFKQIFSFAGWNIYGTGVWMLNQQGINIVLNLFFGPVVNAARGIAQQVTGAINNFCVNFFTAVRPQIVKTYAAGDMDQFTRLIYMSSKYSVFLLWILCLPVFLRIDYILSIWLKNVPDYSALFIRWVIAYMVFDTLNNPLWSAIQAVGKLKKTILYGSTYFLLAFPFSYLALFLGGPAWIVYPILVFFRATYLIIVFCILQEYIPLSRLEYLRQIILPTTSVIIVSLSIMWFINQYLPQSFGSLIVITLISFLVSSISIFSIGMSKHERNSVIFKIKYGLQKFL